MSAAEAPTVEASNELVRWLRLLALPLWARVAIAALICCVMAGALALLGYSALTRDGDLASSAIALLTISLPVLLIVIALVFGQNSNAKLQQLTSLLLRDEIPAAIRANMGDDISIDVKVRGCCADYSFKYAPPGATRPVCMAFSVELNVYKANVCFWMASPLPARISLESPDISDFHHVFLGAVAEGYRMNEVPVRRAAPKLGSGVLFFRTLAPDFLVLPGQRLYFVQDLSFFVRGVFDASLTMTPEGTA